jgi:hypothetical protein
MMILSSGNQLKALLVVSGLVLLCLRPIECVAAGYGNLAGVVSDNKGTPLMGATVILAGPTAFATEVANQTVEHIITDAHGRFTIGHLVPGWYSLKVSSPTRLPAMRNGIRVEAGETVIASFILTDTFAPIRFQVPSSSVSSWGDDWKWVLRTSSTTRPILRFRQQAQTAEVAANDKKPALPPSHRFLGILPGSSHRDLLASDPGMTSVFAYTQAVTPDSDMLVAGSFGPFGPETGALGAMLLRNQLKGEPQQLGLFLHQFSLAPGTSISPGVTPNVFPQAKGMAVTYSETRLIAPRVTVTVGMDINYLNSIENVMMVQPRVHMEYQATPQTVVSARYGSARADGSNSMMDRLDLINAFPRITQRNSHLEMEQLNHAEITIDHRLGKSARVQAAAYHDSLHNAAVWGLGSSAYGQSFIGNSLPNPAGNGIVINAGDYQSAGFRAVFAKTFGSHLEVLGAYSSGRALTARGYAEGGPVYQLGELCPEQTNSLTGKVTAELPGTHTRFSTSYGWVPNDRVTLVDPAGQGNLQVQPYLGVHIRQPIPAPNFFPVHIDAVADFQNLLSQGYVPSSQSGQRPMVLSSGYRYIRGGFSVQF